MPENKLQDFIFSILMVIGMVYCMTVYNLALEQGLAPNTFWDALRLMWVEVVIAFFVQRYLAKRIAARLLHNMLDLKTAKPTMVAAVMSAGNVMVMAPCMTLLVNILHQGFSPQLLTLWLSRLAFNFPFALVMQAFYIGPLVRLIFRQLLRLGSSRTADISSIRL